MDVRVINAFVYGVRAVFSCNGNTPGNGQPMICNARSFTYDISGIFNLTGEITGMAVLSMTHGVAERLVKAVVPQPMQMTDAVKKMCEKLAEAVRPELKSLHVRCLVTTVVMLKDQVKQVPTPRVCVPFAYENGEFVVEFYARKKSSTSFFKAAANPAAVAR